MAAVDNLTCRKWAPAGAHSVGRTLREAGAYPEPKKCYDPIPDPEAVRYMRNDRGIPMKLDNNYFNNILVDHELAHDPRTRPYVKKMAKSRGYFSEQPPHRRLQDNRNPK